MFMPRPLGAVVAAAAPATPADPSAAAERLLGPRPLAAARGARGAIRGGAVPNIAQGWPWTRLPGAVRAPAVLASTATPRLTRGHLSAVRAVANYPARCSER